MEKVSSLAHATHARVSELTRAPDMPKGVLAPRSLRLHPTRSCRFAVPESDPEQTLSSPPPHVQPCSHSSLDRAKFFERYRGASTVRMMMVMFIIGESERLKLAARTDDQVPRYQLSHRCPMIILRCVCAGSERACVRVVLFV